MNQFPRTTPRARRAALTALAILLVGACSRPGTFPSLARRAQEDVPGRIAGSLPVPVVTTPPTAAGSAPAPAGDPADTARLARAAGAAHERFTAKRATADRLTRAASAATPGSEVWLQASLALADLAAEHNETLSALSALDGLYAGERVSGGDGGAIAAARDQVTAWVADETAVLAELQRRLDG